MVCAVEGRGYVRHCAAMLRSLLAASPDAHIAIDYLHGGDTSVRERELISGMVRAAGGEIAFHHVDDRWVAGLPIKGFTRKATWYRIALDELLPDADRVLYLDADLLVEESVAPLWDMELGDSVLAAVSNVPELHEKPYVERPELGGDPYFNAGVLLLDLAAIRHEGLGERLRRHAVQHAARLRWRDQDALNEVLHDRRLALHPRWNCMNAVMLFDWADEYFAPGEVEQARRRPAIRHFEGPTFNKPWHLLAEPAGSAAYRRHRLETPWPRFRPTGCTPANLARYLRRRLV